MLERDVAKLWRNGKIVIAKVGLENQSVDDRNMPVRVMGYDWSSYSTVIAEGKNYPVATIVLDFNPYKRWTGPKSLYQWFNIDEDLKVLVID